MEKKYNAQEAEQRAQQQWQEQETNTFNPVGDSPAFTIDTPPPTVSGSLHIGHVFSYTHTDLLARYKRLRGHRVFYPMGFDDNGLPTERYVEKKHKTKAHVVGRSAFIKLCQEEVQHSHKEFAALWQKMGLSIDWRYTYSTISDNSRKLAQENFLDLLAQNKVHRIATPALYCTTCSTSVAQAELDSEDRATLFNTILFKDANGKTYDIATTRPELLPACVAVFYHPDDSRFTHLKGKTLTTPHYNVEVPCLPDEQVDPEKGTGLVMCCTFGDQTDITWYQTHKLPLKQCMDGRGIWKEETGELAGLRADQARKKIIEVLQGEGLLTEQKKMAHAVNIHERCKQPIEFRVIPQWFVKINEHKQALLDIADEITWKPAYMKARYIDWVENLGWDWCISRQRFYGVPFPVWYTESGEIVTAPRESLPIDPTESPYPGDAYKGEKLQGETDVMDTWNISSLTPFLNQTSEPAVQLPMSLRPQAHDIIRTWAFYTIVKSYFATGKKPWGNIVISGHVTQGSGKLSKSTGGGKLTPESLLASHSADAIRYWTAKGAPGVDTAFSEEQLKNGGRLLTKLWNAFRFVREHLADIPTAPAQYDTVNAWLHSRMQSTIAKYEKQFAAFDYAHALESVEQFFWHDFCDNYLEIIKDRLFNPDKYSDEQLQATYATLYCVGFQLLKLYAPFVPHVTETLYQLIYRVHEGTASVHTSETTESTVWTSPLQITPPTPSTIENAAAHMPAILKIIAEVRKLKSELQCSLKTPVKKLTIHNVDDATRDALQQNEATVCGVTKAESIILSTESRENSQGSKTTCDDGEHCESTTIDAEVAL